jgi:hypothetical protein
MLDETTPPPIENDPAEDPNLTPEAAYPYQDAPNEKPLSQATQATRDSIHPGPDPSTSSVYLPRVLSDEYGMAHDNARNTVLEGKIFIDGEEYTGDKLAVPYDQIQDKEVLVDGPYRSVRFTYHG